MTATIPATNAPESLPSVLPELVQVDLRVAMALGDVRIPPQANVPADLLALIG